MNRRDFLYGMAIPGLLALGILAAILVPAGDQLGWPRLAVGFAAYGAVNVVAALIGARYAARH